MIKINHYMWNIFILTTLIGCSSLTDQKEEKFQGAENQLSNIPGDSTIKTENQLSNTPGDSTIKTVSFLDLDDFDQEFSTQLGSKDSKKIDVAFVAPVTINQIPPRLSKWLSVVKDSGGDITIEPRTRGAIRKGIGDGRDGGQTDRGIGLSVLFMIPQIYSYVKEKLIYRPANEYNVIIAHNPQTGVIEKFTFVKK